MSLGHDSPTILGSLRCHFLQFEIILFIRFEYIHSTNMQYYPLPSAPKESNEHQVHPSTHKHKE